MFLPNLPLILNMSEQGKEEEKWLLIIIFLGGLFLLFFIFIIGLIFFNFTIRPVYIDVASPEKPIDSNSGSSSSPSITQASSKECKISGCSDELCVDANSDEVNSICIYKDKYACYKKDFAKCEVQEEGNCGWTQSDELKSCLSGN